MLAQVSTYKNFFSGLLNRLIKTKIYIGQWLIEKMEISKRELEPVPSVFTKIADFLLKPFVNKNLIPQILMGPFSFQVFRVSHQLGLFDYLNSHPGATLEEMSNKLKLAPYPIKILILGLTGLKLIKKVGNNYYNSAATRIVTQDKTNKFTHFFPQYLNYAQHILLAGIHHLEEAATKNQPVGLHKLFGNNADDYYYELSKNPNANELFSQHMSAFSQINADRLAHHLVFKGINSLLDVGGGVGDVALSIAKVNPTLTITVFDHPSVSAIAEKKFQELNLAHRLHAIGANMLTHAFPENFEGVLFSHFIDIFSPDENKLFFQRAFTSLKSNGSIIVYTPVVQDNEKGPLVNCLLGVYFLCLANGKGRFYSSAQIKKWMQEIGFVDIKIQFLPSGEAIVTGKKP